MVQPAGSIRSLLRKCAWNAALGNSTKPKITIWPSVKAFGSWAAHRDRLSLGLSGTTSNYEPIKCSSSRDHLAETMEVPENKAYTKEITRLTRSDEFDEALKMFNSIETKNTIVWTAMLSGALRCGKKKEGIQLFEEMKASGIKLSEPTYTVAMTLYRRCKRRQEGLALWEEMRQSGLAKNEPPFVAAMKLCADLGLYQDARRIFDEMVAVGVRPRHAAYNALIDAAANVGDLEQIDADLQEMTKSGLDPDHTHYACMLKACRNRGNFERAEQALDEMARGVTKPTVVHFTIMMSMHRLAGTVTKDPDGLEKIGALVAKMGEQGIPANSFFLEEHLAALLGGDLDLFTKGSLPAPSEKAKDAALTLLRQTELRRTRLVEAVEEHLKNPPAAAPIAATAAEGTWHEAFDESSGRPYYWHSVTREARWEKPSL